MTIHDGRVTDGDRVQADGETLELLTDGADVWTVVPIDATGDERVRRWLSVDAETLCDLEAWR